MSPTLLSGPEMAPKSGTVKRLVIFLHGLGSDGQDLIGLAPMLQLPDTQFCSPNAPFPCDMAPYGYQWFSLLDRDADRIVKEIAVAAPILDHYIDAQLTRFQTCAERCRPYRLQSGRHDVALHRPTPRKTARRGRRHFRRLARV